MRAFLNADRTEEIIFTRNATEAINLVAQTFGRERHQTAMRSALHHGAPFQHRAMAFFATARRGDQWAPIDEEGNFLLEEFEKLLHRAQNGRDHADGERARPVVPVKEVIKRA